MMKPLKDLVIIKEIKEKNELQVSELSKGIVISVGPEVKGIKAKDIVYFYKKNNRIIDLELSYIFDEDALFVEGND